MKFAIMENVSNVAGHEIDFDRILVEELCVLGHSVEFYVPQGHKFRVGDLCGRRRRVLRWGARRKKSVARR